MSAQSSSKISDCRPRLRFGRLGARARVSFFLGGWGRSNTWARKPSLVAGMETHIVRDDLRCLHAAIEPDFARSRVLVRDTRVAELGTDDGVSARIEPEF